MAAPFRDINTISKDAGFQGRCAYALTVEAVAAVAELNTVANHNARAGFALKVLAGSVNILQVALVILTNTTIAANAVAATTPDFAILDGDIQFAAHTFFNDLAGVTT